MNRIFRVIWNASTGAWQAVSEVAKTSGKGAKASCIKDAVAGSVMAGAGLLLLVAPALAELPTGGQIVGGTGRISQSGTTLTITQDSQRLAADWQSFSIGRGNTVQFVQPHARAAALNRVLGSDVSVIQGALKANGQVFLVNPNGILFTPTARVDAGALVASTLNLATADFMAGKTRFSGSSSAEVNNQGRITVAEGGHVVLMAARIVNTGEIAAPGGQILMGAGRQITLDLGGPVKLQIDEGALNAQIEQGGAIRAEGGQIYLTAKSAQALTRSVINQTGIIEASSLVSRGGQIVLEADAITLAATSKTQATGATGGGQVLVGGDWQGGVQSPGSLRQATTVVMEQGANIDVSATENGDGGTAVLWSDIHHRESQTRAHGEILAKGGAQGGDGGRVETSGHQLAVDGIQVSTLAPEGRTGEWLLDPYDITIGASASGTTYTPPDFTSAATSTILASDVSTALTSNNVTIQTGGTNGDGMGSGNITVASNISKTGATATTLTLNAHNDIILNDNVGISASDGALNVNLNSNSDAIGTGSVSLGSGSSISSKRGNVAVTGDGLTGSGNVTLGSGNLTITQTGNSTYSGVIAGTGGLTKAGAGTQTLSGTNTYTGATTVSAGTLQIGNGTSGSIASTSAVSTGSGATLALNSATGSTFANAVANAGAVDFRQSGTLTDSGVISGAGTVTQSGTGTTTLTGTNTYSGGTLLTAGTLVFSADSNLGATDAAITFNGSATLRQTATVSLGARPIALNNGAIATLGGGIFSAAGLTTSGAVTGTGGITWSSDRGGLLTLSSANNTFTGALAMTGPGGYRGSIVFGSIGDAPGAGSITLSGSEGGPPGVDTGTYIAYAGSAPLTLNYRQLVMGSSTGTNRIWLFQNNSVAASSTLTINTDLVLQGSGTNALAFGGSNLGANTFAGRIINPTSGTFSVVKVGAGLWGLTAANTYTGATTVSSGTLKAGSTTALGSNSPVTTNATLDLAGFDLSIGSLAGSGTVTNSTATTRTLTTGGNNTSTTFSGVIQNGSGTTALTKAGTGTQTLSGTNTYTGATTVSAGTLQVLNTSTSSATGVIGTGAVSIAAGAVLAFNNARILNDGYMINNVISGAGSLLFNGPDGSITTLGTAKTYSGGTTIVSGIVNVNDDAAFGTGTITATGGAIRATNWARTIANSLVMSGTVGFGAETNLSGSVTLAGNTTVTPSANVGASTWSGSLNLGGYTLSSSGTGPNVSGGSWSVQPLVLSGPVSGSGGIAHNAGSGTLVLSGANTYTGATTVGAGTGTLKAGSNTAFGSNSAVTANGTLDLAGFDLSIGSLAGSGTVTNSTATTKTLTTGGNNTSTTFSGVIMNGSGTTALTKAGTGTQTLSGANTYTGATTVSAGTLEAGSTTALGSNSALTANGTLDLAGFDLSIGSLAGSGTVTNSTATTKTLTTGGNNTSTTFSGVIQNGSGTTLLTKAGTGTQTLSGTNTYTGTTTISAGTLQIGSGGTTGSLGTGAVTNNSALVFNRSDERVVSNTISGTGSFAFNGTGKLWLTSANTYSGGTSVSNGGYLGAWHADGFGTGSVTINANSGLGLAWNTGSSVMANAIVINSSGVSGSTTVGDNGKSAIYADGGGSG